MILVLFPGRTDLRSRGYASELSPILPNVCSEGTYNAFCIFFSNKESFEICLSVIVLS